MAKLEVRSDEDEDEDEDDDVGEVGEVEAGEDAAEVNNTKISATRGRSCMQSNTRWASTSSVRLSLSDMLI